MTDDPFEVFLKHSPHAWRQPIVNVADTAWVALKWFQARKLDHSAADVLRMTEMIMEEGRRLRVDLPADEADV